MQPNALKLIEQTALKAGRFLRRDYGEIENLQVSKKGPGNFVTSADLKAEKIIIEELRKSFPTYSILSEEAGYIPGETDRFTFIIDPIDGTNNFMHGLPFFCISIALVEKLATGKKRVVASCIYSPILDELYTAELGRGAYVNDKKLYVSARSAVEECMFASYIAKYNQDVRVRDFEAFNKMKSHVRIYGSAALELAFVAAGKLDGMWHSCLKSWDFAGGILLVTEAKGIVSEIDGGDNFLDSGSIIAANGSIFEKLRSEIAPCYAK